MYGRF